MIANYKNDNKLMWEKFKLPTIGSIDIDDDDEDDEEDREDSNIFKEKEFIPTAMFASSQNPFSQLKTYNLWIVHVNFKLTKKIVILTNKILGVESIEVVSPYRMILSIGKAFDEQEVRMRVNTRILKSLEEDNEQREKLQNQVIDPSG